MELRQLRLSKTMKFPRLLFEGRHNRCSRHRPLQLVDFKIDEQLSNLLRSQLN